MASVNASAVQLDKTSHKAHSPRHNLPITSTMFLDALMGSLSARTDDQRCLFTLCLLYAFIQNEGTYMQLCGMVNFTVAFGFNEGVHRMLLEAFSLVSNSNVRFINNS